MNLQTVLRHDLLASVVVFLVALPLCMGIAIASGVPPAAGLIAGIIGGIVVGALSGSPLQVSGPAAGLAVLVFELVGRHGLEALGGFVLFAGMLQFLAGVFRLGQWFRAVAPPVVYGMLAGIGVLIFASQFHVMVDDRPGETGLENLLSIPEAIYKGLVPGVGTNHHHAALVGVVTIGILGLWARVVPRRLKGFPAPLVAVLVAIAVVQISDWPIRTVEIPDNLLDSMSLPSLTSLSALASWEALVAVLGMAVVASAETLLCAGAVDRMQPHVRTNYDQELRAQGVGNAISGLLGALPITGVIVRSSANVHAGARTRASAVLHGVWLVLLVVAFPNVLRLIPTSSLGAILVYTGYKLVNRDHIRDLITFGREPMVVYGATVAGIVFVDLLSGVAIGLGMSLVRLLRTLARLHIRVTEGEGNRVDLHIVGTASFMGIPKLVRVLERIPVGAEVHVHVKELGFIDHACLQLLGDWGRLHAKDGARVVMEWDDIYVRSERQLADDARDRREGAPDAA